LNATDAGVVVIGIGNPYRGDDAVGVSLVRRLRDKIDATRATILEFAGDGASLMSAWEAFDSAILVDATLSGAAPGTIQRIDATSEVVPAGFFRYSTHAFGVAEAIELARTLNRLPPRLVIFGIEGTCFEAGAPLSAPVLSALATVEQAVMDELVREGGT
jgi:hydrogenase maturation protease